MCEKCDAIKARIGEEAFDTYVTARHASAMTIFSYEQRYASAMRDQDFEDAVRSALGMAVQIADLLLMTESAGHSAESVDRYAKAFDRTRDELASLQATVVLGIAEAREGGLDLP